MANSKKRAGKKSKPPVADKQQPAIADLTPTVVTDETMEKMSGVILEFARPLIEQAKNKESIRKVVSIAIIAWNIAILPVEQQPLAIENIMERFVLIGDEEKREFVDLLKMFIERKQSSFAGYTRPVLDYKFVESPTGGISLAVVSGQK